MKILLLPLPALLALLLASCSTTPATRIANHPNLYEELSPRHKELATAGKIEKGMPQGGVYLAWGNPDSRSEGETNGSAFQRWSYNSLRPYYTNRFYGGYGYGYGSRYGGYGHHGRRGRFSSFGYSPQISYVPYRSASVIFENGRVHEWSRVGQ